MLGACSCLVLSRVVSCCLVLSRVVSCFRVLSRAVSWLLTSFNAIDSSVQRFLGLTQLTTPSITEPSDGLHRISSRDENAPPAALSAPLSAPLSARTSRLGALDALTVSAATSRASPRSRWCAFVECARLAWQHFRIEGIFVAFAFVCHRLLQRVSFSKRDAGERAAERFLRAMGFRILARNWRSPRDPRDEADLIALTPCGEFVVIVEVKRAAGPWDALDRVDGRKREVLWRLLLDLSGRAPPRGPTLSRDRIDRRLARALELAPTARVDLVGVRGEGHGASAVRHVTSILERRVESRVRIKRE